MYARILVPVDLAHADKLTRALDVAGQTARQSGAAVVYLGIYRAPPLDTGDTEAERMAAAMQAFAREQAEAHGIAAEAMTAPRSDLTVNIGADIIDAAMAQGCDLILMASHVPGLREHFLSSNGGYVAAHATISVHLVR